MCNWGMVYCHQRRVSVGLGEEGAAYTDAKTKAVRRLEGLARNCASGDLHASSRRERQQISHGRCTRVFPRAVGSAGLPGLSNMFSEE